MTATVKVPPHIVTCAVRYALGRSTYIVGDLCDLVTGLADDLGDQRQVIARDIEDWLRLVDEGIARLQHAQDVERWRRLHQHLTGAEQ